MERTDRPREGKGGALPEEQEEGPGFPHLLHSGRKWHGQPPLRGKVRSQASSPCLDLGSPLVHTGMVGSGLRCPLGLAGPTAGQEK